MFINDVDILYNSVIMFSLSDNFADISNVNYYFHELNEVPAVNNNDELNEVPVVNNTDELNEIPAVNNTNELNQVPVVNNTDELNQVPVANNTDELNEVPAVNNTDELGQVPVVNNTDEVPAANDTENKANINYNCKFCNENFKSKHKLRRHACLGKKNLQCPNCPATFVRPQGLKSHMRVCNSNHTFCEKCNKNFENRSQYRNHLHRHKEQIYQCEFCKKKFYNPNVYRAHLNIHTKKKSYVCHICNKNFNFQTNLNSHLLTHSDTKQFKCEICSVSFRESYLLRRHINIHTKEKSYLCEYCGKIYYCRDKHRQHLYSHKNYIGLDCSTCGKKYKHVASLRNHERFHCTVKPLIQRTLSDTEQFKCEICSVSFRKSYLLERHMNIHTKEKSYVCEYCGKIYYCHEKHRQHLYSHKDYIGLDCSACGRKYKHVASLRNHERYSCTVKPRIQRTRSTSTSSSLCKKKKTKKLFQPSSLLSLAMKAHLNNSSGSKMFKCEICSASFISSILLKKHKSKYKHNSTKSQPRIRKKKTLPKDDLHKPETCSASISSSESQDYTEASKCSSVLNLAMNAHLNNPSSVKMYKCETCSSSFTSRRLFESHRKNHNNTIDLETQWWTLWKPSTSRKNRVKTDTPEIRKLEYAQFLRHCRSFENTSKYGCGLCEEAFSSITGLNEHLPNHKDESFTLCMICAASFSFTYELIEHCFEILNDKHYLCKTCIEKFENSDYLIKHLQEKHSCACEYSQKSLFQEHDCSIKSSTFCKETFNGIDSFNQHFATYLGVHLKAIQISPIVEQQQFQCTINTIANNHDKIIVPALDNNAKELNPSKKFKRNLESKLKSVDHECLAINESIKDSFSKSISLMLDYVSKNIENKQDSVLRNMGDSIKSSNQSLNDDSSNHCNDFDSAIKSISDISPATQKSIQISSCKSICMDLKNSEINTNRKNFVKNLDASKKSNESSNNHSILSISNLSNNNKELNHSNPINALKKLFSSYDIHEINDTNQQVDCHVNLSNKPISVISVSNLDKNNQELNQIKSNSPKKVSVSHEINTNQQVSVTNSLDGSIGFNNMPNINKERIVPDYSKQQHQSIYSCKSLESEPNLIENGCSSMKQNIQYYSSDKSYSTLDVSFTAKYNKTNEFLCVICDENYVNKWSFKQHMLAKHSVKQSYTCEHCEKKFSYISVYRNHLASHKLN